MKGNPMDPLGMGSLQFLSRVAVHLSCHSCWETARSRAMETRQAANVARAETRSKESNSMVMERAGVSLCLCGRQAFANTRKTTEAEESK